MSHLANRVRKGFYLDSVALMRLSQSVSALPGVASAAMMIGTPANLKILDEAGLLDAAGRAAGPNDLIVAVRGATPEAAQDALARADALLARPPESAGPKGARNPRSLDAAIAALGGAELALVSVPGAFAAAEARKALARGLHAMVFSDNVPVAEERALKLFAREKGLLVMGPDCGTAILGGVPLAFANAVPGGDIGIVAASGTGLQEVATLIARAGFGVSHAIGTGGRDLSEAVGALTTLAALDAFDADRGTRTVVVISKPPAPAVARAVLERVARSPKPHVICFLGAEALDLPPNARAAATLAEAAALASAPLAEPFDAVALTAEWRAKLAPSRQFVRGVYSGGTLCAEAQILLRRAGAAFWSNAPVPGAAPGRPARGHVLIDYGADEYTRGRPHPMIDPTLRDAGLVAALDDPSVASILIDIVIGTGANDDPAEHAANAVAAAKTRAAAVVACVVGTDLDAQNRAAQVRTLEEAGIVVAPSHEAAARLAIAIAAR
ncbi:MAG: acyl-CoA synthetase FdrA [Azospirillum sp.]|nr:acyl-CoA synthetase FdrA [Azospirillum sp.]